MRPISKPYDPARRARAEAIVFLVVVALLVYFVLFDGRWEWPPPWRLR